MKTVKPAKVAAAKPATPQARPGLFAPDTGVDTTATVSSAPPSLRHGCGTMACKNYTLMGVGF